jgi:hypothetical protein
MLITAAQKFSIDIIYELPDLLLTPHKFSLVIGNDIKIVKELAYAQVFRGYSAFHSPLFLSGYLNGVVGNAGKDSRPEHA